MHNAEYALITKSVCTGTRHPKFNYPKNECETTPSLQLCQSFILNIS